MRPSISVEKIRKVVSPATITKYWWLWCLILITLFAFWTRSIPAKYGELQALDPFYAYRMNEYMLEHNLLLPPRDMMRYWPDGVPLSRYGPIMAFYIPVIVYLLFSFLGIATSFLNFAIIYPAIMGAVSVFIIFWIAKEIFKDNKAGLFAAIFLATVPAYIARTSAGFFDKEATGGTLLLLAIFMFLKSYNKNSWKWGLFGGLVLGVALNSWAGSNFILYFVPAFLFIKLLFNQYDEGMLTSSLTFFIPGIIIKKVISASVMPSLEQFFTLAIISLIIIRYLAEKYKLVREDQLPYLPIGIMILLIVSVLVGSMFSDYLFKMLEAATRLVTLGKGVVGTTVAEQMPGTWRDIVSRTSVNFSRSIIPMGPPFDTLFSVWFLMLVGVLLVMYNLYSKQPRNWMLMLPVIWLAMSIQTVFFMVRLIFFLAPPAALLAGYSLSRMIDRLSALKFMKGKEGLERINIFTIPIIAVISFIILANLATGYVFCNSLGPSFNQYWRESMNYLATKTPVNSSVISWWDFGYWFQTRGKRPSIADGGNLDITVNEKLADWFVSNTDNWNDFRGWLIEKDVKYILMDYTLPGKYGAISKIASRGKQVIGMLQLQQKAVFPQQNKTIIEYRAGQYTIWLPVTSDGGLTGPPIFMVSQGGQYMGRSYITDICDTRGIVRFKAPENANTMPGCITVTAYGLFFVPPEAEFSIFTNLMFMDGYGNPDVEKVFDNKLIKIYKLEINETVSPPSPESSFPNIENPLQ